MNIKIAQGPRGIERGALIIVKGFNRTGGTLAKGFLAFEDIALSAGETTDFIEGSESGAQSNFVQALTAPHLLDATAHCGMAMEDIADDAEGNFLIYGRPPFLVDVFDSAANTCLVGDKLVIGSGGTQINCNQVAVGRIIGFAEVTASADVNVVNIPMFFDGINWLGAM